MVQRGFSDLSETQARKMKYIRDTLSLSGKSQPNQKNQSRQALCVSMQIILSGLFLDEF